MRKIEFRAKDLANGKWQYGYYLNDDGHDYLYVEDSPYKRTRVEIDPRTLGQYVGLRDYGNRVIFEGDIVEGFTDKKREWMARGAVIWGGDSWHIALFGVEFRRNELAYLSDMSIRQRQIRVVGNIYDGEDRVMAFLKRGTGQ